ncbi:DUF3244 domain-containing protein [uncultured Winogradskyella sp.]|uniref:DUF3244 domain-containing protein n=1 Tax=uncultured Winogradskyella sp. TaxID=395353 RepID=UPI0026123B8A|nr:DUF3244 domain-containing protein [uncultured Winogradskyella sp.]
MKNVLKKLAIVALLLGTSATYANDSKEIVSIIKNVEKGDQITVKDDSGEIIYNNVIANDGNLTQLFDFSKLRKGDYTVEINKDYIIEINTIKVTDESVYIVKSSEEKVFKPVFRPLDNKLIISKIALDARELDVELYYKDELIFSENVEENEDVFNRIYKLDKTNKGFYKAIVKTNERVFVEYFRI